MELLDRGSPAAAAQVLQRASTAEPASRSVREALARAQFDAGRYADAADNFRVIVEASPSDDYAHFGLGLALARTGDHAAAAEYLALAAAMRPEAAHYTEALRSVRATLRAREDARQADQDIAPPGAPEGAAAGIPEDSRPGAPVDAAAGIPEDSRPGAPVDAAAGIPEDSRPGAPEGAAAGTPEDSRPGTPEGARPGTSEDGTGGAA